MEVILARPRGFCAGVEMAIETLSRTLNVVGPGVYAYHEIVHNQSVVADFRARGVTFVENIADVPNGAVLVTSAHGVSPEVKRQAADKGLKVVDSTCPLVSKVHMEALRFSREGFHIVYVGHKGHQEVVGTMGEAPSQMHLVETLEDVEELRFEPDTKLAYLTQTTLSVDDTKRIVEKLKEKFPTIVGPKKEDICYATQNRQDAVKTLSPKAHLVLIVGSQNSSNSQRLLEVANNQSIPAYLIGSADDLQKDWFEGVKTVLLTAGASAPEPLVQQIAQHLKTMFGANVSEETIRTESVSFPLPKSLHQLSP